MCNSIVKVFTSLQYNKCLEQYLKSELSWVTGILFLKRNIVGEFKGGTSLIVQIKSVYSSCGVLLSL